MIQMHRSTRTRRVSRTHPCPICGHPDWCLVAKDGAYAICMRVASSRPSRSESGGWVHRLHGRLQEVCSASPKVSRGKRASEEQCDLVYRELLAHLDLSSRHRAQLRTRGFSSESIGNSLYRTLPPLGRPKLCRAVQTCRKDKLTGVPGFWLCEDAGRSCWTLCGSPGLLIPVRDVKGQICAIQIRRNGSKASPRYVWLSSAGKPGGACSGAPCHIAQPLKHKRHTELWVTEGPLKGDLASEFLQTTVVAAPGVGLWRGALEVAAELRPSKGTLVVAFDMDFETNPQVARHRQDLLAAALREGWDVRVAQWKGAKGLDDALRAGIGLRVGQIRVVTRVIPSTRRKLLGRRSILIQGHPA